MKSPPAIDLLAELASEYWKLLRGFERAISLSPEQARPRLSAQVRYAQTRLDAITSSANMRIVSFDGVPFNVNLPATAINSDEFDNCEGVLVERTLEPALVADMTVIMMGKVFLAKPRW